MLIPRPQTQYRKRLLQKIACLKPGRILEVGSGGGEFLRSAVELNAELRGIDPDESSVTALRDKGFSVKLGRAEHLEYPDNYFDAVVFCFTAHHIENWGLALPEAMRVGQVVLVLDPWYETDIPSQAVAKHFDDWCKAIDRTTGMVHNDSMSLDALLAPVRDRLDSLRISINFMLELRELGLERMLEIANEQLGKVEQTLQGRLGLDALAAEARLHGFSDNGAVLLSLCQSPHCVG